MRRLMSSMHNVKCNIYEDVPLNFVVSMHRFHRPLLEERSIWAEMYLLTKLVLKPMSTVHVCGGEEEASDASGNMFQRTKNRRAGHTDMPSTRTASSPG